MDRIKGIICACISAATFGMIPLFANTAMLEGINNDTILVYRYVIAALVYGIYLLLRRKDMRVEVKVLWEIVWVGVGGYGLTAFFLFMSYHYMPTGVATSIHYLYPVVVAVFMALFFKERLSLLVKCGIVLAIAGVYFLSWSSGEIKWVGLVYALMTTITYGTYIVSLNRPRLKILDPDVLTFYVLAFTAVFYLIVALSRGSLVLIWQPHFLFNMSMLGILSTVISARLLVSAVKLIGSIPSSVLGTLEPITAIAVGLFFFHEHMNGLNFMGLLMVIGAVLIVIIYMKKPTKMKVRSVEGDNQEGKEQYIDTGNKE